MIVTLRPIGREEYALSLDGPPRYGSAIFGGYESAEIDCQLDDRQRLYAKGGTLRIHGVSGIVWQGIVTRRPGKDEPLTAKGWGWCATLGRREAMYCSTALSDWTVSGAYALPEGWSVGSETATLNVTMEGGRTYAQYSKAFINKAIPTTESVRISGTATVPASALEILIYASATRGVLGTLIQTITASGAFTVDVAAAGTRQVSILVRTNAAYSPATEKVVSIADLKIFGAEVTALTTTSVIKDVIAKEIPSSFLPAGAAYQAWIDTEATVVEPMIFESSPAEPKIEELTKYASSSYGWYMETVNQAPACVPHWTPLSTTPDYIIRLDEAEEHDLDESTIDEMYSAVRVAYETADGKSASVDVFDTDTTHPLVQLGVVRFGDLQVQTSSSTTATTLGQQFLAENGREQVKGSISTRYVRTSAGADVYLPSIRPGRMARIVGLPDGQVDCTIRRVNLTGDQVVSIELDNDPYALDLMLARLSKREQ